MMPVIDPLSDDGVDGLIKALRHEDARIRANTAMMLADHPDSRALEALIAACSDDDAAVREAAVRAVGEISSAIPSPRADEVLERALDDPDWGTRQSAAEMLARGADALAERALKLLVSDLQNQNAEIRLGAAWSLVMLKDERALDPLVRLLYQPDEPIIAAAALALAELGDRRALGPLTTIADNHTLEAARIAATEAIRLLKGEGESPEA